MKSCPATLISLIVLLLLAAGNAGARRQNTMQPGLNATPPAAPADNGIQPRPDSILTGDLGGMTRIAGYDKPVNANRESMFVTNLTADTITAIAFDISYFDTSRRLLHRRQQSVDCDIPAGETRMVSFPSWDRQHSFYYIKSAKPRRQATPYDINCRVVRLSLRKNVAPDSAETNPQEVETDSQLQ